MGENEKLSKTNIFIDAEMPTSQLLPFRELEN
jgi:hypothetical protein